MRGKDTKGYELPITRREREEALPHARRRQRVWCAEAQPQCAETRDLYQRGNRAQGQIKSGDQRRAEAPPGPRLRLAAPSLAFWLSVQLLP